MKKFKNKFLILGCCLILYFASYLILSLFGCFEPEAIGLNGVKSYAWAPKGFVHDFHWNRPLLIGYLPLWMADNHLWHKMDDAGSGKYPIDEVSQEDIGKVYRAWD